MKCHAFGEHQVTRHSLVPAMVFFGQGSTHCVASRVGDDGLRKHVQLEVNQYRHIVQMGHDVE